MIQINEIILGDCMDIMPLIPELKRDVLAIVDPPYNVGASDGNFGRHGTYRKDLHHYEDHDKCPEKPYFDELFRVSNNQIIWGMNYYPEFLCHSGAIVWNKKDYNPLSDAEIAFQSINKLVKVFNFKWAGFVKESGSLLQGEKTIIHPNQKPIALYVWILKNYAKPGDLILDTHSGSGSLACACHLEKYDFIAIEKDPDYHRDSVKRLDELRAQGVLF